MQLSLTPEEFERLLKLAYLGEIAMNDWTPPEEQTEEHKAATDLLYDLCQHAEGTSAERYVVFDEGSNEWIPGQALKDEMGQHIWKYDNDVFWDELTARLAGRDLLVEYGDETLKQMSETHRKLAEAPLLDYYWREVRENGLDRLVIREDMEPRAARRRGERERQTKRERPGMAEEE